MVGTSFHLLGIPYGRILRFNVVVSLPDCASIGSAVFLVLQVLRERAGLVLRRDVRMAIRDRRTISSPAAPGPRFSRHRTAPPRARGPQPALPVGAASALCRMGKLPRELVFRDWGSVHVLDLLLRSRKVGAHRR